MVFCSAIRIVFSALVSEDALMALIVAARNALISFESCLKTAFRELTADLKFALMAFFELLALLLMFFLHCATDEIAETAGRSRRLNKQSNRIKRSRERKGSRIVLVTGFDCMELKKFLGMRNNWWPCGALELFY